MTIRTNAHRRFARLSLAATIVALPLSGCGSSEGSGSSDRERLLSRCMRSAERGATPEQARSLCECSTDGLIREGMSTMDMLTNDRAKDITRQCAIAAGISQEGG